MTKLDNIYQKAIDGHGLMASSEVHALDVGNSELAQYARRGSSHA